MDTETNERDMLIHPLVWNREEDRDVRMLFVRDLIVAARIGVHHQEQGRSQKIRINLCAYMGPPYDWQDRLEDVLDYDRLRQGVLDILSEGHINLLETLGERIIAMCFAHARVQGAHLQIAKLEAHRDCEVGYETLRRR
jgi:dihydroneopterin aldolase